MTTRTDHDLTEVRALLRDLAHVELRNDGDRRFVETWRNYLDRTGDGARIGRWRLASLRRVASAYRICEEGEAAQAGGLD